MNIDPIRAAVAPYALAIKFVLLAVLAASLFIGGCNHGAGKWKQKYLDEAAAHDADEIDNEALLDALDKRRQEAEAKAEAASEAARKDRQAADQKLKGAQREAQRNADLLAAALRDGKRRLSTVWACDSSGSGAGGAAADAGQAGAAGRYDSAARIVAAGDADAAVIDWLWDGWTPTGRR
jgi:chromosome segregation ATPase